LLKARLIANQEFMKIVYMLAETFYKNESIMKDVFSHIRKCHKIKYCNINMIVEKCHHCDCQRCLTSRYNQPSDRHHLIRYTSRGYKVRSCVNTCQFVNISYSPPTLKKISAFRYLNTTSLNNQGAHYAQERDKLFQMRNERKYFRYIHQNYCFCKQCEPFYTKVNYDVFRSINVDIY
jgi:hypothetical protein